MRRPSSWLMSGLVLAGLVVPAHAGDLVSPRLTSGTSDSAFCSIVNSGKNSITVTVEMLSFDGSTIAHADDLSIDSQHSTSIVAGGFHTFHCRFTGSFANRHVRAAATVSSGGHTIVAVPAQ